MKNFKAYTFLESELTKINQSQVLEILSALERVKGSYQIPIGKISSKIKDRINDLGYTPEFNIDESSQLTLGAIKGETIFQAQLGNAARFYADLLKIEYCFRNNLASNAIYVCFSRHFIRNHYSSNIISIERATREYKLFNAIIKTPIHFICIEL